MAVVILFVATIFFVLKYVWDNQRDNVEAAQLLKGLSDVGLPPGSKLIDDGSDVGNWVGSSNMLQMMAYRVFTCPLPQDGIEKFYKDTLTAHPVKGIAVEDVIVVGHGKTNLVTPHEIVVDFEKAPKSEQANTYAIYVLDNPTGGLDIRGW